MSGEGEILEGKFYKFYPSIIYDSSERNLYLDLYLPDEGFSPPYPAVVYIHGGGWMIGTRRMGMAYYWSRYFACRGYAFADVEYRLAPEIKFPQDIRDIKCAVRWLRGNASRFRIDKNRFLTFGGSAGGHLTAMVAVTSGDHFFDPSCPVFPEESLEIQAAIPFYGIFDWKIWYEPYGRFLNLGEYYLGEKNPSQELLERVSPVTYANQTSAHFLIIQGDEDMGVAVVQGESFHNALTMAGVDSTLIIINGATHAFDIIPESTFTKIAEKEIDKFLLRVFGQ